MAATARQLSAAPAKVDCAAALARLERLPVLPVKHAAVDAARSPLGPGRLTHVVAHGSGVNDAATVCCVARGGGRLVVVEEGVSEAGEYTLDLCALARQAEAPQERAECWHDAHAAKGRKEQRVLLCEALAVGRVVAEDRAEQQRIRRAVVQRARDGRDGQV